MIHQVTPMQLSRGHNVWAAEAIKKEVSIPVFATGSITQPDYAEEILASGKADFISMGRPLLADPYWAKKAMEGHAEDISPASAATKAVWTGAITWASPSTAP